MKKRKALTRSEQMTRIRSKNTQPEMMLRSALWRIGFRYRLHARLPGKPDIVFLAQRLAVFVDGCFWHGCPVHYRLPKGNRPYWSSKIQLNRARDLRNSEELRLAGWRTLRIWEHEVEFDPDASARAVAALLARCSRET